MIPPLEPGTPAIIVDIDGTLAIRGDREPYDFSECLKDSCNVAVRAAVHAQTSRRILLVTGRPIEYRSITQHWLAINDIDYDFHDLYMRPYKDHRKSFDVKRDLYTQYIQEHCRVWGVYEDRLSDAKMWQALGLQVFYVGDFTDF